MIVRIKFNLMSEIADDYRRETKARQIVGIQRKRASNGGQWGRKPAKINWRTYDELKAKGLKDHAISKVLEVDWRTLKKHINDRL
jgi:DNA invertase Pin-like site-specific DNA recombinase